ncbi:sensor histidine kinase [Rhizobium binxianense]
MRRRLAGVAVAALLPVVALLSYNEFVTRQQRNGEVRAQASQAARQASSEVERILEGMHSLLIATATLQSIEDLNGEPCTTALKRVVAEVAPIRTIFVLDRSGKLVCDSLGTPPGLDFSDRSYFREALESEDFVVGGYTMSRLSDKAVLPVAMPLRKGSGVVGVIATGLRLEWLDQRLKERGVLKGNAVTIADRDGIILARDPMPERFVGTRIPDAFQPLVHASQPGIMDVRSQDGTDRVLGYEPIRPPLSRLYVSAGVSKEEAFASINRSTAIGVISIVVGALLSFAASVFVGNRFILQPIFRLLDVLERWRKGDITARTGMAGRDELRRVGSALDGLLDELDERQRRQEKLQEARDLLVGELRHRIKNTLTIVQAIARQSFRPVAPGEYVQFSERLRALASGYDLLFADRSEQATIPEVVTNALKPHIGIATDRISIEGDPVLLAPPLVLSLSLVIHELATNAIKYGALSNESGRIRIAWEHAADRIELKWIEQGGPPVVPPNRRGFGSRLIQGAFSSAHQPVTHFDFAPAGLVFNLIFKQGEQDPAHWNRAL